MHVPREAWLCRVTRCYASAAGLPCEERASSDPGSHCDCMPDLVDHCIPDEEQGFFETERTSRVKRMDDRRRGRVWNAGDRPRSAITMTARTGWDLDPPPGGWYGEGFCPQCAADSWTCEDFKAVRRGQKRPLWALPGCCSVACRQRKFRLS